jgi:putative transposase
LILSSNCHLIIAPFFILQVCGKPRPLGRGMHLIAVPPHNTSRTCPACGHVSGENRKTQAKFVCVECGYENNADVVGAINVLERGQRLLACGELVQSGRSVKQEPAEVS